MQLVNNTSLFLQQRWCRHTTHLIKMLKTFNSLLSRRMQINGGQVRSLTSTFLMCCSFLLCQSPPQHFLHYIQTKVCPNKELRKGDTQICMHRTWTKMCTYKGFPMPRMKRISSCHTWHLVPEHSYPWSWTISWHLLKTKFNLFFFKGML